MICVKTLFYSFAFLETALSIVGVETVGRILSDSRGPYNRYQTYRETIYCSAEISSLGDPPSGFGRRDVFLDTRCLYCFLYCFHFF